MKKKILIINDIISGGGVENVLYNLALYLYHKEYNITIVTRYYDDSFKNKYPKNIKYLHLLDKQYQTLRRPFGKINEWLRKGLLYFLAHIEFDIVISIKEGYMTQWGALCKAKKKYAWVHVDYDYLYWTKHAFGNAKAEVSCMKQFDKVVCVSNAAKDSVIHTIGDPGNLCVIYNPINVAEIRTKANESTEHIRPKNKKLLVAVGRLTDQKNFEMLLRCVSAVDAKDKFELWIVGDGPNRNELEALIEKNKLLNVRLLGAQKNPYPIMKQADWIVSSALWESFGLVLQEAVVLGVPVLTTSCPAVNELFDDDYGIIVENTETALTDALCLIVRDDNITNKYSNRVKNVDCSTFYESRLEEIEKMWME